MDLRFISGECVNVVNIHSGWQYFGSRSMPTSWHFWRKERPIQWDLNPLLYYISRYNDHSAKNKAPDIHHAARFISWTDASTRPSSHTPDCRPNVAPITLTSASVSFDEITLSDHFSVFLILASTLFVSRSRPSQRAPRFANKCYEIQSRPTDLRSRGTIIHLCFGVEWPRRGGQDPGLEFR